METVSLLEFRRHAEEIISKIGKGKRMILTYRGKPVVRLEPILDGAIQQDDPFYSLPHLAELSTGESITNEEIDQVVYEK